MPSYTLERKIVLKTVFPVLQLPVGPGEKECKHERVAVTAVISPS